MASCPLAKGLKKIAVIGPNADDPLVLLGNYNGFPSSSVTPLAGIKAKVGPETEVAYAKGCTVRGADASGFDLALAAAAGLRRRDRCDGDLTGDRG